MARMIATVSVLVGASATPALAQEIDGGAAYDGGVSLSEDASGPSEPPPRDDAGFTQPPEDAAGPRTQGAVPVAIPMRPSEGTTPIETEVAEVLDAIHGQDLSTLDLEALLENVVVTATKSALGEDEAPAVMTVIGRDEILRWGYQSVDEVLRHVAGIYVVDDHVVPNVAIRGISGGLRSESGLIKVMIDGHSVTFRSTAGHWLGPELVPLSAVQRIEIIRGPASSLYGADAFMGVINVVTRRAEQMQGGDIGVSGNHQGAYGWGQDVALGVSTGRWHLLAAFKTSVEDRSGLTLPPSSPAPRLPSYAPADRRSNGLTRDSKVALARATLELGKRGSLALSGYWSEIDRQADFADWSQLTHNLDASGRRNGTDISLRQGTAGLDVDLHLTETLDVRASGLVFAGGPTARDRIDVGSDLFYVRRDFGYRGFDASAEAAWQPRDTLRFLVGTSMLLDYEDLPVVYDVLKSSLGSHTGERAGDEILASRAAGSKYLSNVGVNGLAMWSPIASTTITGGLRYDYHSVYGGKVSGRLGGVVALSRDVHAKLLYGSAFKAPSPQLLYGSPLAPGDIAGNQALKPSYVHTVEAQLSARPNRFLLLTSGVAYSYLLDQATFALRGINQVALNISRVESISWETELRFDYRRKLAAYGNVTLNHTRSRLTNDDYVAQLSSYGNAAYPVLVANAGTSAQLPRLPVRLSVELSYVGTRRPSSANTLDAGGIYQLASYTLVGASLRTIDLRLLDKKETILMLVARNLANTRYADPGFAGIDYPQLGRTLMAQVIQEF
jgi:outer membrane receptor for ferrienterochelin and colicins